MITLTQSEKADVMEAVAKYAEQYGLTAIAAVKDLLATAAEKFNRVQTDDAPLVLTQELKDRISKAEEDMRAGRGYMFDNAVDAQKWLESL